MERNLEKNTLKFLKSAGEETIYTKNINLAKIHNTILGNYIKRKARTKYFVLAIPKQEWNESTSKLILLSKLYPIKFPFDLNFMMYCIEE